MEQLLSKIKLKIILKNPFLGSILSYMRFVSDYKVGTFCINSKELKYNPDFVRTMTENNLRFILAHEALHIAGLHHLRMKERDEYIWNEACDYAINRILIQNEIGIMPDGCLYDERFNDMSSEEIYNILEKEQIEIQLEKQKDEGDCKDNNQGQGQGQGQGQDQENDKNGQNTRNLPTGYFEKPKPGSQSHKEETELRKIIQQCKTMASGCGDMSKNVEELVDEASKSKIRWVDILLETFDTKEREDYSFLKPNTRYQTDFILPSLTEGKKIGDICIVVDTSGSMSVSFLSKIKKEIIEFLNEVSYEKVYLIECDCEIQRVFELTDVFDWDEKSFKGRGGTSLAPPFYYIKEKNIEIESMIYFTDLCVNKNKLPPSDISRKYDTYWVKFGNFPLKPKFGTLIEYESYC